MVKAMTATKRIEEFRAAFTAGIDGIVKAAEVYVAAIDNDPRNADKFQEEFADTIPASAWYQFEAVGRKWMHPKLIMGGMRDRKKAAIVKKLPYSTQERIFTRERFPLLISGGQTLKVDMIEATTEQARQLCNGSAMRGIAEQKAWMESRKTAKEAKGEPLPYAIHHGKLHIRRGVTLTKAEIRRILQEM